MLRNILALIILVPALAISVKASPPDSSRLARSLHLQSYVGQILPIHPAGPEMAPCFFSSFDIRWHTNGSKYWHQFYGYPQLGLSFNYGYLGDKEILGHSLSVIPVFTYTTNWNSRYQLEYTVGFGLTWFNKPYHLETNPQNILIGSSVSNMTIGSILFKRRVDRALEVKMGISFFHSSNSHTSVPNVGINAPTVTLGLSYIPDMPVPKNGSPDFIPDSTLLLNFRGGMGYHEYGNATFPTGGPKYPVYTLSSFLSKRLNYTQSYRFGVNVNYYSSFYNYILNQEVYYEKEAQRSFNVILFLEHEFLFGRVGFITQVGINVYKPFIKKVHERFYGDLKGKSLLNWINANRIGFQYYLKDPKFSHKNALHFGVYVKTNFGQADFLEGAVGYSF